MLLKFARLLMGAGQYSIEIMYEYFIKQIVILIENFHCFKNVFVITNTFKVISYINLLTV